MTGLYTTIMNVFAGLASGLSVPLSHHFGLGWQGSLAACGVLGVLGLIVWIPHLRERHLPSASNRGGFWRSPLAWEMTLFMGLQSFLFYVNVAWLPTLLHDRGLSLNLAGWLVSLMQIISLPGTFLVPIWAGRQRQQISLVLAVALAFFMGYLGLLVTTNEAVTIICLVLVGFGAGASISLALALFSLRTRHHEHAGQISGMAQSVGYLLAALGPLTVGYLYTATHSWTWPILLLLAVVVIMAASGVGAGRDRFVDAPSESPAEAL
jgi:CP family cyanate transporter-like MFS transporter